MTIAKYPKYKYQRETLYEHMLRVILVEYLTSEGYIVYPRSMRVGGGLCSVVAYKHREIHTFGIRKKRGRVHKVIERLIRYKRGSHYCIAVVGSYSGSYNKDHKKRFKDKGIGLWKNTPKGFKVISRPELNKFVTEDTNRSTEKFVRKFGAGKIQFRDQTAIDDFK